MKTVCFVLCALALVFVVCEARVALIASGGGIRATLGSLIAIDELKQANLLPAISEFYGLSGGAWAVEWLEYEKGDVAKIIRGIKAQKKGWGKFTDFSPVKCGKSHGWFSWSCHTGWRNSIKKDLFKSTDATISIGGQISKKQQAGILIDTCVKKSNGAMKHDGQCFLRGGDMKCTRFANLMGKTKISRQLKAIPSTEVVRTKFDPIYYKMDTAQVQHSAKDPTFTPANGWDWLSFTSSAWAETGSESNGWLLKTPAKVKIDTEGGKTHTGYFCDAGAVCNIPLSSLVARQTEQLGGRIHRAMLFDFSDDGADAQLSWRNCVKFWKESMDWDVGTTPTMKPWGFTHTFNLNRKFGIQASITIDYFKFKGTPKPAGKGDDLILSFPTIQKRLGLPVGPKSYDKAEVDLFFSQYGTYMKSLIADKNGPFKPLHEHVA